ncbi:MAG: FAD-dependent oxidoreductase [Candidatus Margulisiibacteriota bacterium]|jgi:hypothetical protein
MSEYDVLVCGGGVSGCCAALASARNGARTLLVEETSQLGGAITQNLVYPMMTFHSSPLEQVIKGIPEELIGKLVKHNGSVGHISDPLGCAATMTPVDTFSFKKCITEELKTAKVDIVFNSRVIALQKDGVKLKGATIDNGINKKELKVKTIIDATGDADIAVLAGVPFILGREADHKTQPLTLIFQMEGIESAAVREYIRHNPDEFVLSNEARKNLYNIPLLAVSGFFSKVKEAQKKEGIILFRDRVLYFDLMQKGEIAVNMTRVSGFDPCSADELLHAKAEGEKQVRECVYFMQNYLPGFTNARLLRMAPKIGIRESRHIIGHATLTRQDVLTGSKYEDGIACGAFPIDIHSPDGAELQMQKMAPGTSYNIPYRCLLPQEVKSLLVTGRAISATHEASASARLSPTCLALGQAAGTAAALAAKINIDVSALDPELLRKTLAEQGAVV